MVSCRDDMILFWIIVLSGRVQQKPETTKHPFLRSIISRESKYTDDVCSLALITNVIIINKDMTCFDLHFDSLLQERRESDSVRHTDANVERLISPIIQKSS
jgi:hypothetical protein